MYIQQLAIYNILSIILFIFIIGPLHGQTLHNEKILSNTTQKSYTIPFKFINNTIIIDVIINHSKPMQFILDTGVPATIITSLVIDEELSLNYARKIKISGLGNGEPAEAYQSTENQIKVGPITGKSQEIYVLLRDYFKFSNMLGTKINGLIGYQIFHDFIVEINYQEKTITFYNPDHYTRRKKKSAVTLPLILENKKPYLSTTITTPNGNTIPVKLLVDTGGGFALWLSQSTSPHITLPQPNLYAYLGSGLNGPIYGHKSRIPALQLGPYQFSTPTTSFPNDSSINTVITKDKRNGSLGNEILRRFTVVFNYPEKEIILTPNHHLNDAFHYNMSGLELEAPLPDLPLYTIANVLENSPADKAGVQPDDQIIAINYKRALNHTLQELSDELIGKEGKKIRLIILRNNKRQKIKFSLKDII